jgi:hypothetical protein
MCATVPLSHGEHPIRLLLASTRLECTLWHAAHDRRALWEDPTARPVSPAGNSRLLT